MEAQAGYDGAQDRGPLRIYAGVDGAVAVATRSCSSRAAAGGPGGPRRRRGGGRRSRGRAVGPWSGPGGSDHSGRSGTALAIGEGPSSYAGSTRPQGRSQRASSRAWSIAASARCGALRDLLRGPRHAPGRSGRSRSAPASARGRPRLRPPFAPTAATCATSRSGAPTTGGAPCPPSPTPCASTRRALLRRVGQGHRLSTHRRHHRARPVVAGAPPTAVARDQPAQPDMVLTQRLHDLEPPPGMLPGPHRLQAPR
jgi:hypothetical protein